MKTNHLLKLAIFVFITSMFLSCKKDEGISKLEENDDKITQFGSSSNYDSEILNEINKYRKSKGLAALVHNDVIWKYANEHSKNMAKRAAGCNHKGFYKRVDDIKKEIGGGSSAENVAYGHSSAEAVVEGWVNSDGHRKNIEGNFQLTGISAVQGANGRWYYTQIFLAQRN